MAPSLRSLNPESPSHKPSKAPLDPPVTGMTPETGEAPLAQMARNLLGRMQVAQHSLSLEDLYDLQSTLSQTIALVKESINHRRSPIVNIPVEIFEHIFRHAIQWRDSGLQCRGFDSPTHAALMKERLRIAQVCRRWRAVSMSTPSLWTTVDNFKEEMFEEFLRRSQHMSLDVFLRDTLPPDLSFSAYAPRIRDLYIMPPENMDTVITCQVPQLECLTVVAWTRSPRNRTTVGSDTRIQIVLPSNLPALRVLVVHELQAFPVIPYPQLTRLYIGNSRLRAPRVLLDVLERCAQLERLVLVKVAFMLHGPKDEQRVVPLPRLQLCTLGIDGHGVHARPVLRGLALPPTVALRIFGSGAIEELANFSPFPALPCLAGCTDLAVDCGVSTGPAVDNSSSPTVTLYLSGPPGLSVGSLRMSWKLGVDAPNSLLSALLNTVVPFAALERVTLRVGHYNPYVTIFNDTLARAATPSMRVLRFVDKTTDWHNVRIAPCVAAVLASPDAPRIFEVWTAHPRVLAGAVAAGALERVVYHPTVPAVPAAADSGNIAQVMERVRARVPEVEVYEAALPSIPGIDDVEKEYGFY